MKYCEVYHLDTLKDYRYVVVFSLYQGKLLLSKHKQRTTYETQGGHIEENESPLEAARRELYEESGAPDFDIEPLCDYQAGDDHGFANGVVFVSNIQTLGELPKSEMASVHFFDELPEALTYPHITPVLYRYWKEAYHGSKGDQ